jgi:hypothetical protein
MCLLFICLLQRIVLSDKSSLSYRRLQELFFQEENDIASTAATTSTSSTLTFGNLMLQRVHQAPNIYTIENFLRPSEIAYLKTKIQHGRFQRSYVDAVVPAATAPVVVSQESDDYNNNNNNHGGDDGGGGGDTDQNRDSSSTDDMSKRQKRVKSSSTTTTSTLYDNQHRTSTFLSFSKQQDAKIAAIEQRAANLLGCWSSQCIEPLQVCVMCDFTQMPKRIISMNTCV